MKDIITVPMSYLQYYHEESVKNPHYTTEEKIQKQIEIMEKMKKKGGIGLDDEVAIKTKELACFNLK